MIEAAGVEGVERLRAGRQLAQVEELGREAPERREAPYGALEPPVRVAEARADGRSTRCVVEGSDSYGVTAAGCVEALVRMADATFDGRGALAPSEAFDPDSFLTGLGDYLSWRIEESGPARERVEDLMAG